MNRSLFFFLCVAGMFLACENSTDRPIYQDIDFVFDKDQTDLSDDPAADDIVNDNLPGLPDDLTDEDSIDEDIADETPGEEDSILSDFDVVLGDCPELAAGWNTNFIVNGEESKELARSFILSLPDDIAIRRGWPVVFNWHGVGVTADFFLPMLDGWQNNDIMPFILVTPEDMGLPMATVPPQGVDWDNLVLDNGSIEAEFFDRLIECLDRQFGIDMTRIHMTGFSAGSITCDSLGVMRGEQIASIFTYSGAYFSNPANPADLGATVSGFIKWPTLETANKFTQVLVHGAGDPGCGTRDCGDPNGNCCDIWSTIGFSINFGHMSNNDAPYLSALGHDVILCDHGQGHLMGGVTQSSLIQFFKDHPLGTEISPYRNGLTGEFADVCALVPAQ
ncbi:MAG TPA: hypothetical protein PLV42_09110 [bacterium]|nr:hypothetical protein [bacterium]